LKADEAEKARISGQPKTEAQVSKQEIEKLTIQNKGLQGDIVRLEQNKQILQVEKTVAETQIEKIYFVAFAVIAGLFVVAITLGFALVIVSWKKVSAVKAPFQPNTPDTKSKNKVALPAFSAQSQRLSLERDKHQSTALLSFSRFVSATCKFAFFPMLVAALVYGDHLNEGQLLPDDVYCLLRAGKVRTTPGSMRPITWDAPGGNPIEWRVNPPSVSCQHESLWSGWTKYSTKISLLD
jgi:hypothetical protein